MSLIISHILDSAVEKIVHFYNPKKVILFGSYAYGKPSEESDVDILIIVEELDKKRGVDRFVEAKRLIFDPNNNIPLSPIILTEREIHDRVSEGDDFLREVLEKGKVLYER